MAAAADMVSAGFRFNPLLERSNWSRAGSSRQYLGRNGTGLGIALRRQQDLKQFPSFPAQYASMRRNIVAKSSNDPNGPASKSFFSFNIIDALAFLIRIPALILGLINKEKEFIDKVEDQLDNAAETVGDVAEAVEKVAGFVERVAESIAEDARETRELMDKVEATTDSMRSDINTAIDTLQDAVDPEKSDKNSQAPDAKAAAAAAAAAEAASRTAEKARDLKDAAKKLEEKQDLITITSKAQKESAAAASDSAAPAPAPAPGDTKHFRAVSWSSNSSSFTVKLLVLSAILSSLILSNLPWSSTLSGALLKHAIDFLVQNMN